MTEAGVDLDALRQEIEKLILLEQVAERRQQLIEERLDRAIEEGMSPEQIRSELGLSKESIRKLLKEDPPSLAERLGISKETAENLSEPIG
jgi:DNA-directed RNA polymerase sigma subunit (sigma70/sigma32)